MSSSSAALAGRQAADESLAAERDPFPPAWRSSRVEDSIADDLSELLEMLDEDAGHIDPDTASDSEDMTSIDMASSAYFMLWSASGQRYVRVRQRHNTDTASSRSDVLHNSHIREFVGAHRRNSDVRRTLSYKPAGIDNTSLPQTWSNLRKSGSASLLHARAAATTLLDADIASPNMRSRLLLGETSPRGAREHGRGSSLRQSFNASTLSGVSGERNTYLQRRHSQPTSVCSQPTSVCIAGDAGDEPELSAGAKQRASLGSIAARFTSGLVHESADVAENVGLAVRAVADADDGHHRNGDLTLDIIDELSGGPHTNVEYDVKDGSANDYAVRRRKAEP